MDEKHERFVTDMARRIHENTLQRFERIAGDVSFDDLPEESFSKKLATMWAVDFLKEGILAGYAAHGVPEPLGLVATRMMELPVLPGESHCHRMAMASHLLGQVAGDVIDMDTGRRGKDAMESTLHRVISLISYLAQYANEIKAGIDSAIDDD